MTVVNYETFDTNEDFVTWQKVKFRNILNVQPIAKNLDGLEQKDDSNLAISNEKGKTSYGVFVTYTVVSEDEYTN